MSRKALRITLVLLLVVPSVFGGGVWGDEAKRLRVCADPNNLPFSNEKQEGFENRIAELTAKALGANLSYYWWPHERGLVRNTLGADRCDVIIGIPKEYERVLSTKPYYRTGYVIAYLKDRNFHITSLDDPILNKLRIGVLSNTPPHMALAERGILGDNLVQYSLYHYDWDQPEQLGKPVKDLLSGKSDIALLWGPIVGYYVKKHAVSSLVLVPLKGGDPRLPMSFDMAMGVKRGNKELKVQLDEVLTKKQAEITHILEEYGVPLFPAQASAGS